MLQDDSLALHPLLALKFARKNFVQLLDLEQTFSDLWVDVIVILPGIETNHT